MSNSTRTPIYVSSHANAQLEKARLAAGGFTVVSEIAQDDYVLITMVKKKELNIPLLVICVLFWILPAVVYLLWYGKQEDQVVEIVVGQVPGRPTAPSLGTPTPRIEPHAMIQMSPDGRSWWDGQRWMDADTVVPPQARRSSDGKAWWDGQQWRPVPTADPT